MNKKQRHDPSIRCVAFLTMTYCEDRESVEHIANMLKDGLTQVAWAVHDKDKDTKAHRHCIVKVPYGMTLSAFAKRYGVKEAHVQNLCKDNDDELKDAKAASVYLVHADSASISAGKHMYGESSVVGPWADWAIEQIRGIKNGKKRGKESDDDILAILDIIESHETLSTSALVRMVCEKGLYSVYRRSASIVRDVLREHNDMMEIKRQEKYSEQRIIALENLHQNQDAEVKYRRIMKAQTYLAEVSGGVNMDLISQIMNIES